jgi:hypothetical protein
MRQHTVGKYKKNHNVKCGGKHISFVVSLFKELVSNSYYTVSDNWMIMNNKPERKITGKDNRLT